MIGIEWFKNQHNKMCKNWLGQILSFFKWWNHEINAGFIYALSDSDIFDSSGNHAASLPDTSDRAKLDAKLSIMNIISWV